MIVTRSSSILPIAGKHLLEELTGGSLCRKMSAGVLSIEHAMRENDIFNCREFLVLLSNVSMKVLRTSADHELLIQLVQNHLMGVTTNVKQLELVYTGSRTSFQTLLSFLRASGAITLSIDPKDQRRRLVELSPAASELVDEYFAERYGKKTSQPKALHAGHACTSQYYDRIEEVLTQLGGQAFNFERLLDLWGQCRGWRRLPRFNSAVFFALSERTDVEQFHVVRPVSVDGGDFEFTWIGASGRRERDMMSSRLLSSLPDQAYRECVATHYQEARQHAVPRLDRTTITTGCFSEDYFRLILPFGERGSNVDTFVSVVAEVEGNLDAF